MTLIESAMPATLPLGVQRPRLLHLPPTFCSTAGEEFIALAASTGLILDDWQRFHVRAMTLETQGDTGLRWAAMENASIVARQNGKGSIITALELGFLFLTRVPFLLHTAHETRTAKEGFQRLLDYINASDELRRQVVRVSRARGDEGIELTGGRRLQVVARTSGAGRGLSAQVLIWDEAYALTDEQVAAQMPVMLAQPNPWVGYFSSAAKESSAKLHNLRERALSEGDDALAYLEHGCDPDAFGGRDSDGWAKARRDPAQWATANPALGIRIRHDTVSTLLASMSPQTFDREVLGVPDIESDAPPVVSVGAWNQCADPESGFEGRPVFAVDVSPGGEWASISVVGIREDGMPHVELVDNRPGVDWVAARRTELDAAHRPRAWVRDPNGPAVELAGKFRDLKAREAAEASSQLLTAVKDRTFRWVCDSTRAGVLNAAVAGARRRESGDGNWRWSRRDSSVDISPIVSMTLALWAAPIARRKSAVVL